MLQAQTRSIDLVPGNDGYTIHAREFYLSFWLDRAQGWSRELAYQVVDMLREIEERTCSLDYKSECESLRDEVDLLQDTVSELKSELEEYRAGKDHD